MSSMWFDVLFCVFVCHCSWKTMKPLVGISFWLTFWLPLVHFISNILSIALLSSFYCYILSNYFPLWIAFEFTVCALSPTLCIHSLNLNNKLKMPFMQISFFFFLFNLFAWPFLVILTMKCTATAVAFGMQKCGHKQKKEKKKRN